jgi:hypothetical protein
MQKKSRAKKKGKTLSLLFLLEKKNSKESKFYNEEPKPT